LNIGRLDREIEIQQASLSNPTDGWRDQTETWTTTDTVWATRKDKTTSEAGDVRQNVALTVTEWTIRFLTDVTVQNRVKYGTEIFYITGIRELGRREGLVLVTEKRDNGTG
jgi:SPP1 family predicted phage head-tail adaptor|tara:strand:- start:235 stop:567 length:333 start_codon:yes stop_codon:yes gene_type:complete